MKTAVQFTMYLNQSDRWHKRPLHVEILQMLRAEGVAGASAFHAVAGFNGRDDGAHVGTGGCRRRSAGRAFMFVDYEEHVNRVLPKLLEMAPHRLIVRENVVIEQGNL